MNKEGTRVKETRKERERDRDLEREERERERRWGRGEKDNIHLFIKNYQRLQLPDCTSSSPFSTNGSRVIPSIIARTCRVLPIPQGHLHGRIDGRTRIFDGHSRSLHRIVSWILVVEATTRCSIPIVTMTKRSGKDSNALYNVFQRVGQT